MACAHTRQRLRGGCRDLQHFRFPRFHRNALPGTARAAGRLGSDRPISVRIIISSLQSAALSRVVTFCRGESYDQSACLSSDVVSSRFVSSRFVSFRLVSYC
jgi:hypothetical protein